MRLDCEHGVQSNDDGQIDYHRQAHDDAASASYDEGDGPAYRTADGPADSAADSATDSATDSAPYEPATSSADHSAHDTGQRCDGAL